MTEQKPKLSLDERLSLRKERINARKNQGGKNVSEKEVDDADVVSDETKKQIQKSRDLFDEVRDGSQEKISIFQVNQDLVEITRRKEEEASRRERSLKLYNETLKGAKDNAEIEAKWNVIAKRNEPDALMDELKDQFNAANDLVHTKDEAIKELTTELQSKDDAYVKLLARHHEDIAAIVEAMTRTFSNALETSESELLKVEETANSERVKLIEKNLAQIQDLFTKRKHIEQKIMQDKAIREEGFQNEISLNRAKIAEQHNSLKIELQNSIQLLELQLEEMRATYQLNTEKLKYNRDVLMERNTENQETDSSYFKRIQSLNLSLSTHKARFKEDNEAFAKENAQLTDDYKKMSEQFKDLQKKYHHFETVDTKKYKEVWDMNEAAVMELVHKALQADQIIHQQVLGLQWKPPGNMGVEKGYVDIRAITPAAIFSAPLPDYEEKNVATSAADYLREANESQASADNGEGGRRGRFNAAQLKEVLQMIEKQAGFLIDGRRKADLDAMSEDEAELARIDAILTALGVEDKEDLDELVAFFIDEKEDNALVDPNDVVTKLQEFVQKRLAKTKQVGVVMKQARTVQSEKKLRRKERERKMWTKLGLVISDKTVRMWTALEGAQRDLNLILEERAKLIDETTELARQNEELKILLQEYLSSKINQELEVPPTRLIRM